MEPTDTALVPARVNVLGVNVSAIDMELAARVAEDWIARRDQHYVCITGMHGVMESQRDPALMAIHNEAGLVTPDGMPLVWMSHLLGFPHVRRVYGPDLMRRMCAIAAEKHYSIYLYGASEHVLDRLQRNLRHSYPGLHIAGAFAPPFRPLTPDEDDAVVSRINAAAPDIIWIGLSTPKQERWMAAHAGRVSAPVMVGVGAAFDFIAATKKQAPPWMRNHGLEWLYRMLSEPRRLARRYLTNIPAFVWLAACQLLRQRRADRPTL